MPLPTSTPAQSAAHYFQVCPATQPHLEPPPPGPPGRWREPSNNSLVAQKTLLCTICHPSCIGWPAATLQAGSAPRPSVASLSPRRQRAPQQLSQAALPAGPVALGLSFRRSSHFVLYGQGTPSSIRPVSPGPTQRDGRCLGSDLTQTLHKRASRSTRHAWWHQREIVPVWYGVVWCAHYAAVLRRSWHRPPTPAPSVSPPRPRGLSRPEHDGAPLSQLELPATSVPHRPNP